MFRTAIRALVCAFALVFLWAPPPGHAAPAASPSKILKHRFDLNLSDEQVERIRAIVERYREKAGSDRQRLGDNRRALVTAGRDRNEKMRREVDAILRADQRTRLAALLEEGKAKSAASRKSSKLASAGAARENGETAAAGSAGPSGSPGKAKPEKQKSPAKSKSGK